MRGRGYTVVVFLSTACAVSAAAASVYLTTGRVPSAAHDFLTALGDRMQKPGSERVILEGNWVDSTGSSPAKVTWEAPGSLRLDRSRPGAAPLTLTKRAGDSRVAQVSTTDSALLESLLDDRAESMLYSLSTGAASRFLGARFRSDGGKTTDFSGPWYDIYEVSGTVVSAGSGLTRQKYYCFNSDTKLLELVTYVLNREGTKVTVTTRYGRWTTQNGQPFPGTIIREENGTAVFTFQVRSGATAAASQDGLFQ
jgi:hypothetical protein